jgi:GTPase
VNGERAQRATRAFLVSVALGRREDPEALEELKQLAVSAGMEPVGHIAVRRERPDPAHYVGSGKVEEIRSQADAAVTDVVIFDVALTPAQQRNLQRSLDLWVLDRTSLILTIFSQRAQSREGKLQVELAQLEHLSTRLVRGWSHLERQRGGLGKTGGPGEKQIELDRRMIGVRVKQLRLRLKQLAKQRTTRRRARGRRDVLSVSLVGYTNAGKSTLFNALTRAAAYSADQLFATLDTTSRRLHIGDGVDVVLSDTVGFIRGLPHQLVEAFKSTLDETAQADLLLHVVDAASPARDDQIAEVEKVLADIGAADVPCIMVFNKIDLTGRAATIERDARDTIAAVSVSAATGLGLDMLRSAIAEFARRSSAADRHTDGPALSTAAAA